MTSPIDMTNQLIVYFDRFHDLLSVLDDEQLVRLAYRLRKADKENTANLLDDIRQEREATRADEFGQGIVGR